MGYSEALCQICGVSFNISRIRTRDEPRSAGWDYIGGDSFIEADDPSSLKYCGPKAGCMIVDRAKGEDEFVSPWQAGAEEDPAPSQFSHPGYDPRDGVLDLEVFEKGERNEHVAGPGCSHPSAYSGHRLSLEEMKGCRTVQCFVRKRVAFKPQKDDEDFEINEDFFLSGIGEGMRDTEMSFDMPTTPLYRHGVAVNPTNQHWDAQHAGDDDMPFHPWCLEVYKRVSLLKQGSTDVPGLYGWWHNEADFDTFHDFPRHGDITRMQEQWWSHESGAEYVAANPLFMPGLPELLRSCISTDPSFSLSNGAFDIGPEGLAKSTPGDPFASLPLELRLTILSDVDSNSLANLRLASRAFRQLPISVWHDLLIREMPWLWEALGDDNIPYSFWATTAKADLAANPSTSKNPVAVPNQLPLTHTNWHQLYVAIKKNISSVKGLRNRERIWIDCVEIVRRIKEYKEAGLIPVQDLVALAQGQDQERRRKIQERYAVRAQNVVSHTAPA